MADMTHATETPITKGCKFCGAKVFHSPRCPNHPDNKNATILRLQTDLAEALRERDAAEAELRSAGERVREECAKVCGEIAAHHFDRYRNGTIGTGRGSQHAEGMADGAEACETAIRRALPVQGEAEPPPAGAMGAGE